MNENIAQKENDEPKPVVTVECLGGENFENMCNEYANAGYILSSSTSCILPEAFHFQTKYVAISKKTLRRGEAVAVSKRDF